MKLRIGIAALVIAAAVAGTALAGPGPTAVTAGKLDKAAKQAKAAKQKAQKALDLANSKAAGSAPTGVKGISGDPGPAGASGAPGDDVASTSTARIIGLPAVAGVRFASVSGVSSANLSEVAGSTLTPNIDIVVQDLAVSLTSAPGFGNSRAFTIRGAGDTLVSCTISSADTGCDSGAASDLIPAGSEFSISVTSIGTPAATEARIGFRAEGS